MTKNKFLCARCGKTAPSTAFKLDLRCSSCLTPYRTRATSLTTCFCEHPESKHVGKDKTRACEERYCSCQEFATTREAWFEKHRSIFLKTKREA